MVASTATERRCYCHRCVSGHLGVPSTSSERAQMLLHECLNEWALHRTAALFHSICLYSSDTADVDVLTDSHRLSQSLSLFRCLSLIFFLRNLSSEMMMPHDLRRRWGDGGDDNDSGSSSSSYGGYSTSMTLAIPIMPPMPLSCCHCWCSSTRIEEWASDEDDEMSSMALSGSTDRSNGSSLLISHSWSTAKVPLQRFFCPGPGSPHITRSYCARLRLLDSLGDNRADFMRKQHQRHHYQQRQ